MEKKKTAQNTLSLFLAGSGSIIPNGGVVVGGKCQVTGSLSSEAVSLSLMVSKTMNFISCLNSSLVLS